MRKTMSNEQRQELIISLGQRFPTITEDQCERVADAVAEWYAEQNTFTDSITTEEKECPTCGALWVISPRVLPRYLIPALRLLLEKPMTAKEACTRTGNRQVYTKFAWMVHWGLIRKVKGWTYEITDKGRQLLEDQITIPEFLWMLKNEVVPTPEGEKEPQFVHWYQLPSEDTDDHAEHVNRSSPASPHSDE